MKVNGIISTAYDPIPEHFRNIAEAAEFWETHDLADYWDLTKEIEVDARIEHRTFLVALEPHLADKLAAVARKQGVSTETLVNVWLAEKVIETAKSV
ncbi:MAG: BrnA antitoxin family protein [Chloroflexi bacterium]|nr:BrnA antitoxin family protein [Chloroflexota bacterium]